MSAFLKLLAVHLKGWLLTPQLAWHMAKIIKKHGLEKFVQIHEDCIDTALVAVGLDTQAEMQMRLVLYGDSIFGIVEEFAEVASDFQKVFMFELALASAE
jgi:hypothetical protein